MYTIVNRRKMNPQRGLETLQRARAEFFPKLQSAPGFVGFYLVNDAENGINTSIIVWDSKEHAQAFQDQANPWIQALDEMGHELLSDNRGDTVVELRRSP
jgi:heme-degrading monooxygenase HmoA